jgi:hypothetical protein
VADQTIVARMKRQRELRAAEGWHEVKVWVPTEQDAADIRQLAAERRAKAEALYGLSDEVPSVTPENAARIAGAIAEHGSAAYTTPSGAVLDLMTQLAEEDDLASFSRAFIILARAKPANAAFVAAAVPAKITNFLIMHRGVDASALVNWTEANPGWEEDLKNAVRNPVRFQQVVAAMAEAIKRQNKTQ